MTGNPTVNGVQVRATDLGDGKGEHQHVKVEFGADDSTATPVSSSNPFPTADAATLAELALLLTELGQKVEPADLAALATAAKQDTGNTSLASILAKLSSDPATQTTLAAVLAKLSSDPATQTTLAAVLAKITADPSTATAQATQATKLDTLHTDLGHLTDGTQQVTVPAQGGWSRRAASGTFAATALRGFAVRETAGAAAVVNIYAGTNNTGTLLVTVGLTANESARESFGPAGIVQSGSGTAITNLFVEVASGTVTGSVFV